MWMFYVLLFLMVVLKNTGYMVTNLEYLADVVTAVKSHYRSGCLAILNSPATKTNVEIIFRLMNLLSHRGITAASPDISHFNISINDDILCRHNHPLYIILQDTAELLSLANIKRIIGPTWLLFTNSSLQIEKLLENIYIPYNCEFLVARKEVQGVFSIIEVYQLNRTQPLLSLEVATWSLENGIKWNHTFLPERRQNLHGHTIKVITYDNPPLMTPVRVGKELRVFGMLGTIWSILEEQLNFTTKMYQLNNGWTSSAIEEVKNGTIDVVLGDVALTIERSLKVGFTVPYSNSRLCTFIRRPASSYRALNNIVAPFRVSLWFTFIGAVLGLAVCQYLTYRIGLNHGSSERPGLYTASTVIFYMLGIFCQQGHHTTPVTWSCRIVYWISYLTAMVLFSAYSGALVSSLANQRIVPPFTTFQGILKHGNYKVATVADSSHLATFRDATEDLLHSMYEQLFDKNNLPPTILEGLQNVCSKPHYAFITTYETALILSRNISCTLMALQEASLPETLAFATSKNFPYRRLINYKLMSLQRSGILNRIKSNELPYTFPTEKSLWISVSIEAVQPIFLVLFIGIVVGVILVMLETQVRCLFRESWLRIKGEIRHGISHSDFFIKSNNYTFKQNRHVEKL